MTKIAESAREAYPKIETRERRMSATDGRGDCLISEQCARK
jgi:hypothetical protein